MLHVIERRRSGGGGRGGGGEEIGGGLRRIEEEEEEEEGGRSNKQTIANQLVCNYILVQTIIARDILVTREDYDILHYYTQETGVTQPHSPCLQTTSIKTAYELSCT